MLHRSDEVLKESVQIMRTFWNQELRKASEGEEKNETC